MPAWTRAVLSVPILAISLVAANSYCDPKPGRPDSAGSVE